jgi:hypothetical protein
MIDIEKGDITVKNGRGAGIGSDTSNVRIVESNVNVTSANGTGIGINQISLTGTLDLAINCSDENAVNGSLITVTQAWVTGRTNTTRLFGTNPSMCGHVGAVILYATTSATSQERLPDVPSIEIGNLSLPDGLHWEVTFMSLDDTWQKTVVIDSSTVKRLFLTVEGGSSYKGTARSGDWSGILVAANGSEVFQVDLSTLFLSEVGLYIPPGSPSSSPSRSSSSNSPSEEPSDHTVRNWKIAFGVVVGVVSLVCVGLLIWLVSIYRTRAKKGPFTPLVQPFVSTVMNYD